MKVVTVGEIMLRLEPEGYFRFVQVDKMTSTFGGGEANVAVSLANYGLDAYYVTNLKYPSGSKRSIISPNVTTFIIFLLFI